MLLHFASTGVIWFFTFLFSPWLFLIIFLLRFVKKKFEELYFQSTSPDRVDRVFKIYRTTALDQKLVKKTFKLVDETLRRRNLFEAGLLWCKLNFTKSTNQWLKEFPGHIIRIFRMWLYYLWFSSFHFLA